jgi:hypothetical protein
MMDYVDDALVETLWQDLDGRVPRQKIARAVSQVAARFEEATVTSFVPIFIRRQALEYLRHQPFDNGHLVATTVSTDGEE